MKTEIIELHPQFPDSKKIAYCANVIRKGGLVVFPTETVYGVGANLANDAAMRRLREVKKRAPDKPFSILISQVGLISGARFLTYRKRRIAASLARFAPTP